MIKIAYIIDTIYSPNAGTEGQLLILLNNLNRRKVQPYLICLQNSDWLKKQSFSFPFEVIEFNKILSYDTIRFIKKFKRLHRKKQFDIVQTFFTDANIIGVPAAKLAGVKRILASRRNAGDRLNILQRGAVRLLTRLTTKYVANSKGIADMTIRMEHARPEQMEVIYNGLFLDKFKAITPEMRREQRTFWNIGEDEILIGVVANLRPVKNIESLIDAAVTITKKYGNLKFIVVGEGGHRGYLQKRIDNAGLGDRFKLAGRYENIIPCLAAFDIGVLCSKAEGFSNSIIEYMAAGLPVVASDVGGNKEAVDHRETGFVYDPTRVGGLSESLSKLIESKELMELMGKLGREKAVASYDVSVYIENHQKFYTRLLYTD